MRVRISTELPLTKLKAWYPVKPSVTTIQQLKYGLTHDLSVLVQGHYKSKNIILQVEGFELLDESDLSVLDAEKDIIR
jgi:hypothetical protein